MALATATAIDRNRLGRRNVAIFECRTCGGWHLASGFKASLYQVHRVASATMVICDGCATPRELLREGEAIPISVGRWPDLPEGIRLRG